MTLFSCKHHNLSRVFTLSGCGVELAYDLATMQLTGSAIARPPQKPDAVAVARSAARRPHKFQNLATERTRS